MDSALARPDQPLASIGGPTIGLTNNEDDGAAAAATASAGQEGADQRRRLPLLRMSLPKKGKVKDEKDEEKELKGPKPVPFHALYRFATRAELCWLAAGLVAAGASTRCPLLLKSILNSKLIFFCDALLPFLHGSSALAGAAQPLMTLILGRFTSSFTAFAQVLIRLSTNPADASALAGLRQAQDNLKAGAARNATWLTIIGIGNFLTICRSRASLQSNDLTNPGADQSLSLPPLSKDFYVRLPRSIFAPAMALTR